MAAAPLAKGMRHTRQRQAVWEAVQRLGGHCTAEEIAAELDKRSPGFPRSTVYRALDALTSSGALHAVRLGEGPVHYEAATGDHQHAVCQVCNGILHIEHDLVRDLEGQLETMHRFHTVRAEVLLVGVCDACARARSHSPGARHKPL